MDALTVLDGQLSHALANDTVSATVTVRGGHLTARFRAGRREVAPFYTAPWWKETLAADTPAMIQVLRGDFFCLPFGDGPVPHGRTANDEWSFESLRQEAGARELALSMDLGPGQGRVLKRVRIREGEPVIYQEHLISGCPEPLPLGHHPILKLPDREGAGIIDFSPPVTGFTTPRPVEEPANRGYSSLKPGVEITDRSRVPTDRGGTVDLTRYPTPRGFEDLVCFVNDRKRRFVYSAVSVPDEGWLYFQLKDPGVLAETVLWMSNGGRHYAPWNGRVVSVLGLEEVTGFFHYGREASAGANFFRDRGFPTVCDLAPGRSLTVRFIMGLAPIPGDFTGVGDIVIRNQSTIAIKGRGGESIEVPCRASFLFA